MKQIKIELLKCGNTGGNFTARVKVEDLPKDILDALRINSDDWTSDYVEITGDVNVRSNYEDDCEVSDLELTIHGAKDGQVYWGPTGKYEYRQCEVSKMAIKKEIWGNIESRYSVDIDSDDRFNIDSLIDDIMERLDSYECYIDNLAGYADWCGD